MNESFQQVNQVNNPGGQGIALKTEEYGAEHSITHSRAISKCSHASNPEEMLTFFQSYVPQDQNINSALQKLHDSQHLKLKKYKQSIYYGQLQGGKRNGTGIMLYNNGRLYEGQWANDLKEGTGFEKFPNHCTYRGGYVAGRPEGVGKYCWSNGEFYEGEWQAGLKHGSGMWRGGKGDSYIGEWKQGKAEGYGVHTWVNGDRYQGQFRACLKHGEGIEKFANGDIYKGDYEEGKPSGFGEYYWSNGSYFKGNFKKGLRSGNGIWKRAQGASDKYEGEYVEDRKNGYGIFTWASGNVYKGHYKEDVRQGYGEMYWSDGSYYKGQWKRGIQHGHGEIFVPGEGWKKGIFHDNVLVTVEEQQETQDYEFSAPQKPERIHQTINSVRYRKLPVRRQNSVTPNSLHTHNPNHQSKTIHGSQRTAKPQFQIRSGTNQANLKAKSKPTKSKANRSINERTVIDMNLNSNHPLLPNRFNKSKYRNSLSVQQSSKHKNASPKEKILHSSFYLHKLHNRRNIPSGLQHHYKDNPQEESVEIAKNFRDIRTGSEYRQKSYIAEEVRSFTKGKINTFNPKSKG